MLRIWRVLYHKTKVPYLQELRYFSHKTSLGHTGEPVRLHFEGLAKAFQFLCVFVWSFFALSKDGLTLFKQTTYAIASFRYRDRRDRQVLDEFYCG